MTNLECAVAVLAQHREARKWTDTAVAVDLLAQFGLDPAGEAADPAAAAPAAAPTPEAPPTPEAAVQRVAAVLEQARVAGGWIDEDVARKVLAVIRMGDLAEPKSGAKRRRADVSDPVANPVIPASLTETAATVDTPDVAVVAPPEPPEPPA